MKTIEVVRQMVADGQVSQEVAEKYFPELKENEGGKIRERLIAFLSQCKAVYGDSFQQFDLNIDEALAWLEKQGEQKPAENKGMNIVEEDMTPFQKKVFCIIDTAIEEEQGLKQVCDELLRLAHDDIMQKSAWSEEDKMMLQLVIAHFECQKRNCIDGGDRKKAMQDFIDWLKSLRPQKQDVMSEDEFRHIVGYLVQDIVANEHMAETEKQPTKFFVEKYYKILRPHSAWKPSEEMLEALYRATPKNVMELSEDEMLLDKLYQGLKYGILSKK